MITINYRIHPSIGIARVGSSDDYYIAPETVAGLENPESPKTTGGLPIKKGTESETITSSDIRDSKGGLKKQAARFKIYQYSLDSAEETYPMNLNAEDIQEITIGSVVGSKTVNNIIWTVHLANKKANTFVLVEDPDQDQGISGYENTNLPPIRNADINHPNAPQPPNSEKPKILNNPERVKQLSIDPGPRTISGPSNTGVDFDAKTVASYWNGSSVENLTNYPKSFPSDSFSDLDCPTGAIDSLGELHTDEKGRLLVLAGNGKACSWGEHKLDADVNNDQWFDDESDGPVYAVIEFDDGSTQVVEGSAWVACTDPSYAPQTLNIVPLFDDIYNSWVQDKELNLSPDLYNNGVYNSQFQPHFNTHLNPIFQSVALQKWNINLNATGISNHDRVGSITAADDPSTTYVFNAVRNPNDPNQFGTLGYMPLALGDANKSMLAVTETQYFYLNQWNNKLYQAGDATQLGPGELLDKNTLMNCLGGRFSPGIDLTFIVRQPDLYIKNWSTSGTGPFRVKPFTLNYQNLNVNTPVLTGGYIPLHTGNQGLEPGDLTKFLAIPWQTDYNSCATHLPSPNIKGNTTLFWSWPAQRPVAVYVADDVAANGGQLTDVNGDQLQQWSVRGEGTSTNSSPAQDWGRYQENINILKNWQNIGVVIQGSAIDPAQGGPANSDYYLEVASLLKEGKTPTNPVEAYPNINGKLPK